MTRDDAHKVYMITRHRHGAPDVFGLFEGREYVLASDGRWFRRTHDNSAIAWVEPTGVEIEEDGGERRTFYGLAPQVDENMAAGVAHKR
jgi:hypothetical protein